MAGGYQFAPLNVRAVYQNDGSAKSSFLAEVARMTNDAGKMFKDFSNEARTQLDAALSVKRNNTGSLDLGVEELKQAAAAQQARAVAAREVAAATALAAQEEGDYSQKARLAVAATQALAIEEERAAAQARAHAQAAEQVQERLNRQASATDLVVAATKRGTSETSNVINGIRSQRVAFVQLGQQIQDVVVQAQMGTSAFTIFSQQVPQAAFALSGLEGNANETLDKVGEFATFLSGPWGAALFAATAVLGPFIAELFQSGDAAKESSKALEQVAFASSAVSNAQGILGGVMDITTGKINTQSAALIALARAQIAVAQIESRERQAKAGEQIADFTGKYGPKYNVAAARGLLQQDRPLSRLQDELRTGKKTADEVVKSLEGMVATGQLGQGMFIDLAKAYANFGVEAENQKVFEDARKLLDGKGGTNLLRPKAGGGSKRDGAKELQRLAEFGEDAGKKIANIRDSFSAIPPEVERINKASRELDDIISDLMNRKPKGFEALKSEAEALKASLADGVVTQALDGMAESADRQLKIQELLLSGRDADAAALQNIWAIEEKIGSEEELRTKAQALILQGRTEEAAVLTRIANQYPRIRSEVQAIADAEQKRIEAMRKAQEMQQVFLDATRDVRSEVEGILGGYRSLGDLGATLRRSFQQIQGKVLFDQIFGGAFTEIDRMVKDRTGIGSSVDKLKTETERAGTAAGDFANAIDVATKRILSGGSAAGGVVAGASAVTAWGNLKIPDSIRLPGYDLDPNGPLTVKGQKNPTKKSVATMSPQELAALMGQTLAKPLINVIQTVLGPKIAKMLGPSIGGALEGWISTGTGFGAVLGGLKEIKGLPKDLSEGLGKAFKGAQTGVQIAGIGNALGLKLSNTGAQIGGAIGKFLPIPGGEIIGAIAGGFIGKLFSGTKKGYAVASNGNVTTGGNRTQADNAGAGANSLNDSLSNIARAFGSSLGNYAVSIGSRSSGYIRVSASGSTRVGDKSFAKNGGSDLLYDGKDMQEALRIALKNAIEDGAIQGIKAGSKRLLSIGNNIDAQVEKALKFEKVFKDLKQIKDPVGFALEELNTEFKGLIDTFKEAGASAQEMAELEELYGIRRKEAIKQATEAALGPIKSLLDSLNIGSEFYSLRDRQASAQAIYNPLAERVKAGDMTAYAEFADAAQSLIEINRQIYGSTSQFFDFVDQVKALSQGTLDREQAKIDAATASDSPFTQLAAQQQATTSAIDNLTKVLIAAIGGRLDTMNSNLIAALRAAAANNNTSEYTGLFAPRGAW